MKILCPTIFLYTASKTSFVMNKRYELHRIAIVVMLSGLTAVSYTAQHGYKGVWKRKNNENTSSACAKALNDDVPMHIGKPYVVVLPGETSQSRERASRVFCKTDTEHNIYAVVEIAKGSLERYARATGLTVKAVALEENQSQQRDRKTLARLAGKKLMGYLRPVFKKNGDDKEIRNAFVKTWQSIQHMNPLKNEMLASVVHVNPQTRILTAASMGVDRVVTIEGGDDSRSKLFFVNTFYSLCEKGKALRRVRDYVGLGRTKLDKTMKKFVITNFKFGEPLPRYYIDKKLCLLSPTTKDIEEFINSIRTFQKEKFLDSREEQKGLSVPSDRIEAEVEDMALIVVPLNQE